MGNVIEAADRFQPKPKQEAEPEIISKIQKKEALLQKAWALIEAGKEDQIPAGELEELKQLGPGLERVVQGRIQNIEKSNKPEDKKNIEAYQKLLGTISKINRHFETAQKTAETQNPIESSGTERTASRTPETQQLIDTYQQYLDANPDDYILEGTYEENLKKLEEITEWLDKNRGQLPESESKIAEQALIKFQNYREKYQREQGKKFTETISNSNEFYSKSRNQLEDIKNKVDELIRRFNNDSENLDRNSDPVEYARNLFNILNDILSYIEPYAMNFRNLRENLASEEKTIQQLPESLRSEIRTQNINVETIQQEIRAIEENISRSMSYFNESKSRAIGPGLSQSLNTKFEEIQAYFSEIKR